MLTFATPGEVGVHEMGRDASIAEQQRLALVCSCVRESMSKQCVVMFQMGVAGVWRWGKLEDWRQVYSVQELERASPPIRTA